MNTYRCALERNPRMRRPISRFKLASVQPKGNVYLSDHNPPFLSKSQELLRRDDANQDGPSNVRPSQEYL